MLCGRIPSCMLPSVTGAKSTPTSCCVTKVTHNCTTLVVASWPTHLSTQCAHIGGPLIAGVTPKLLGHWKDVTTEHLVMELEYQPSTRNFYPITMKELRQYMVGILQVPISLSRPGFRALPNLNAPANNQQISTNTTQILALLHDTVGMIHRDIKRANILAYKTSSGGMLAHNVNCPLHSCLSLFSWRRCGGQAGGVLLPVHPALQGV